MIRHGPSRRLVAAALVLAIVAGVLVAVLQSSGGGSSLPPGGSRFAAGSPASGARQSLMDALAPLLATDRATAAGAGGAGGSVSVGRAVAQLLVIGVDGVDPSAARLSPLRAHAWGGVVVGRANYSSPAQIAALVAAIKATAGASGSPPPLVIARQAGGRSNAFRGLAPTGEPQLGAIGRADLVNGQAQLAARQLRALGVNATLSPDADLADPAGPAATRGYGRSPSLVARLARAATTGYRTGGLVSIVGHFPGEGPASQDPSHGPATVGLSLADLEAGDIAPFAAVAATAPVIQMSNAIYSAFDGVTPATLLPDAVGLLRGHVGYRGIVMSGDLGAATATTGGGVGDAAVAALQAGCQLLYVPSGASDALAAYGAIVEAVRTGRLDPAVVARALAQVLALKRAYRLT